MQLHTCKTGSEKFLQRELALYGLECIRSGCGYVVAKTGPRDDALPPDLCFAIHSASDVRELTANSVNAQANALCDAFWEFFQGEKIEKPWFFHVVADDNDKSLSARVHAVRSEFRKRMRRKMSRVAKLASDELPRANVPNRGLLAVFADYKTLFVGSKLRFGGQRRMRTHEDAPSRSFLKVEEAYGILGREPTAGEAVVDLGAAPGGWSFSAAERGANVLAIDNGELTDGAARHARIQHLQEDAFLYRPEGHRPYDWLFCDLIENPYLVLEDILIPWINNRGCRRFVVNLKVGKKDPVELLRKLRENSIDSPIARCDLLRVRQLYHDREEITCCGVLPA
ncbi:MAG: rRNA methyltransferase [Lentisphaeria bacterium]|nr:rRNA methyltransferase [Lentisphaeria bacterium]